MKPDVLDVISLDRTPERYRRFLFQNPSVTARRFSAVDGRTLDRDRCIADGLITASNRYDRAALGNLASHVALWKRCALEGHALHVAEDDAILRRDFVEAAGACLTSLKDWDFVLWSWNYDWPIKLRFAPGLGASVIHANQDDLRNEWHKFPANKGLPLMARLIAGSGLCCYSLSPAGARILLGRALPIDGLDAEYPAASNTGWSNLGLDAELSRHYASLAAYVSVPGLASTLNVRLDSTV
jgi:glycosyl transferase family 25